MIRMKITQIDALKNIWSGRPALKTRKLATKGVYAIIRLVFLLGFSFIILYPVITMLSKAFMLQTDLYDNSVLWIPKHFTFANIQYASQEMEYVTSLASTFLFCTTITAVEVFICMLTGYGFARFDFPMKKVLFAIAVLTIVVPPQTLMIPQFFNFRYFDIFGIVHLITGNAGIDLMDTYWPYYLLAVTGQGLRNGLLIFLFRQGFRAMPRETEEAAMVDGLDDFRIFLRIMLPNAVTLIVTVFLFCFVWQWNDTFYANLFVPNASLLASKYTIFEYGLNTLGEKDSLVGNVLFNLGDSRVLLLLKNSGVFLLMAPLILLYLFLQRFFVEGIDRTGLVG